MAMTHTPVTADIDGYLQNGFSAEDEFLLELKRDAAENGFPDIAIGGVQSAFLQVFLRSMNAKYVMEIGSLYGYSAIVMARALPDDGKVVCFELQEKYCDYIRKKAEEAGVGHKIEVYSGNAKRVLKDYNPDYKFDFVFIDADKPSYSAYLDLTYPLVRKGGVIAGDNCLAWGYVAQSEFTFEPINVAAIKKFNHAIIAHPGLQHCFVPIGDGMAMGLKIEE